MVAIELWEKYATDEEIYACIEDAYFSTPVIEQILMMVGAWLM